MTLFSLPSPLPSTRRHFIRRNNSLPRFLLSGALLHLQYIAHAQGSGATQPPSVAGFFSQLFTGVGAFAMVFLVLGYFWPQMFAFIFQDKTSRNRVCATFGAAMLVFGLLGTSLEPKPLVTAQEIAAKSAQAKAEDATRVAQENARAAEARATKAEKDAATAKAAMQGAQEEKREAVQREQWANARLARRHSNLSSPFESAPAPSRRMALDEGPAGERTSGEGASGGPASVTDNDEWSDVSPSESLTDVRPRHDADDLDALAALAQQPGQEMVLKVGNDNDYTWGQTTVTLNFDRLASIKKESVVARLNYFYSFPSLATGKQKTIPLSAFRNAQGRAFDPSQYAVNRVYIDARTPKGPKNWDAEVR